MLIQGIQGYRRIGFSGLFSLMGPVLADCRFYPSCSYYAEEAIGRKGAWRGLSLALRRLFRCHPFSKGGWDPVPYPWDEVAG